MDTQYKIQEILSYYRTLREKEHPDQIVSMLRELQEVSGYITPQMKTLAAEAVGVKPTFIQGIIRRFPSLKEAPYRHEITLCSGARCGNKGGSAIILAVEKALGMDGPGLSSDGTIFLKIQNCLKQCRTSANILIDGEVYRNVQLSEIPGIIQKLQADQ